MNRWASRTKLNNRAMDDLQTKERFSIIFANWCLPVDKNLKIVGQLGWTKIMVENVLYRIKRWLTNRRNSVVNSLNIGMFFKSIQVSEIENFIDDKLCTKLSSCACNLIILIYVFSLFNKTLEALVICYFRCQKRNLKKRLNKKNK